MNNFWQRITTGLFFTGSILASIWWGPLPYILLSLLAAIFSLKEFYAMVGTAGRQINEKSGIFCGLVLYLLFALPLLYPGPYQWEVLSVPLLFLIFIAELYRKKADPFTNISYTLLGILYTVLPFALLMKISMHSGQYDKGILMGYFFLLWSNDSFAYVFGNLFGKHRLFERISPKKSWEGSIGGGLSTLGIAYLLSTAFPSCSWTQWMIIAILIIITGTLGDLVESLLKRSLQIKDSGSVLPGHGGLLDRFDALLLSAPFVWAYLEFFG